MKNIISEAALQSMIVKWAQINKISDFLIHIPNGGFRLPSEGAKFKRMGVKSGTPDLFLAYPTKTFPGLWIELKSHNGKLTINQKEFLERMSKVGYATGVCYTFEDAINLIKNYLDT